MKELVECNEVYDLEVTERKRLEKKLEILERKLKNLEGEKCTLAEKIASLNKSIENFLAVENQMQLELQVRDEKIKSQAEEIISKNNQINLLSNNNDKLRNESANIGQRLTNHFDAIMREIRFPEESLNNHDEGRQHLNETANLAQMSPINSTVTEQNTWQSSFINELRSVEANDSTTTEFINFDLELDASTQPTTAVTNNGNKRTIPVDSNDELVPAQAKRLKQSDSTSPERLSICPNRPSLDNLVTSDINNGSVETLETQEALKDDSRNSKNNETENGNYVPINNENINNAIFSCICS